MPQTSTIMMSVSHLHENGQNPVLFNRSTTSSVAPKDFNQNSKDIPLWLRTNANGTRPSTRRGSLEPVAESYERAQAESKVSKGRRRSLDTTMKTPRPSTASRRRTAPDLDLVGATPAEVSIRSRTNVVNTSVLESKNHTSSNPRSSNDSYNGVMSHAYPNSIYQKQQHSQAPVPHRSMAIDCDDGLPGSIQQCSSNLAKQNCQPSRPKSAHHSRYRRPVLESRDIDDVDVETLTLDDELNNMERPGSPTMTDRSVTRLAKPLTPPARPTITLEMTASSEEDWYSDDSVNTIQDGSRSVLRVKRKHLRRKYEHNLQHELEEYDEIPNRHANVQRTHSDGSRNIPANFRVENRSEVAERVVERYRRRAQSDVSSLEQVKHLFADNDAVLNSKHISSNSKPRKLRPILQRSRETMMLGDGSQGNKSDTPDNSQLRKKSLEPMAHLNIPKGDEADVYPSPPNSADKLSNHEFFKDTEQSPRSLKPIHSENDLGSDLLMKKSPFHSRSCPDAAVSS